MNDSQQLPIYELADDLVAACTDRVRIVLQAPTGSGKSTQVPQILLDRGCGGSGRIDVLQPRRLAARMLARRVAHERGVRLGTETGYQVRFTDCSNRDTRIKYVTEGILLRQTLVDPAISRVGTVIFDEFHERHLYGDVTLGLAKRIQETIRPDLKIIVMSATLDSRALEEYLAPCTVLRSAGRMHPVNIEYLDRPHNPEKLQVWDLAAREFDRHMPQHSEGHVLVFMPGAYEIMRTVRAIKALPSARGFSVLALHGELSERDQDAAVERTEERKVVVSTNVAETSLTIDGIRLVIDSGLARVARFDPYRGINTLLIEKISRDSADQRAGRAGRTAPGTCVRLWAEQEHHERQPKTTPEIMRVDLSEIVLTLKANETALLPGGPVDSSGSCVADMQTFPWLDQPNPKALERAGRLLADTGAVSVGTGEITPLGRRLVSFPVHPRLARMLVAAGEYGCVRSAALIAALTQDRSVLVRRPDALAREKREHELDQDAESDLFLLMQAWDYARSCDYDVDQCRSLGIHALSARRVTRMYEFFLRIAENQGLNPDADTGADDAVMKCVLIGFSDQLAKRAGQGSSRCLLVRGRTGQIARESVVRKSDLLVATEIREIEGRQKGELNVLLSLCTAVRQEWLRDLFPDEFKESRTVSYDPGTKRVNARQDILFRDLPVERGHVTAPSPDEAAALLAGEVLSGRLKLKKWDHKADQWVLRINSIAEWCPELEIRAIDDDDRRHLIQQICLGSCSYKEIKEKSVWPVLKNWLSMEQQAGLDAYAPERLALPNGRTPKVTYSSDAPFISARIQELYGVEGEQRIAMGRVPVLIHVLAPNHRPVQITNDLAGFWCDGYPKVKKELQKKYPKHEWR